MKKIKKVLMAVLVLFAAIALVGCKKTGLKYTESGEYSYLTYTTALATNWNPHTWENSNDSDMLSYVAPGFVDMSIKDSSTGEYQWVWEMATSITDVTKDHNDDLVKYGSTLGTNYYVGEDDKIMYYDDTEEDPDKAFTEATIESGYVYEFKLREGAKWENGVAINADSYIESMQLLLDPTMKNYRANTYLTGEGSLAGAYNRYYSGASGVGAAELGYATWADAVAADYATLTWLVDGTGTTAFDEWLQDYVDAYVPGSFATVTALLQSGFGASFTYEDITALNGKTYKEIQADETMKATYDAVMDWWLSEEDERLNFFTAEYTFPETSFDQVGLYKVDDYTIRYVCQSPESYYYFLTNMTSSWLVYAPLYNELIDTTGELKTTTYNSSKETTMSYGPYKIDYLQDGKQLIFVQNEEWYGYTKQADGTLYSETEFEVDGKKVQQYMTTRIVMDVMTDEAAKEAFLKGLLDDWAPASDELSSYASSTQLYQVDETYTMRYFFNTDVDTLQKLDSSSNQYSVVLSNVNFRKAFSLAINRTEFVTATSGYKAVYALLNSLYFYNVYEDPSSIYRNSEQAMQAVCDLYGVEYGTGKAYATLEEAYKSINGYNLTEAKSLMKTACDELVEAGYYVAGQDIKIQIAYKKVALDSDDNKQISLMNKYLNAACEGSGFGTITLEAVGNLEDRYGAVPKGNYAIGYGAWGGAAFYPFTTMQVYLDADDYDLNEGGCWDPASVSLSITFPEDEKYGDRAGQTYTMSYTKWSLATSGEGDFANDSFDVKLYITAQLELNFLKLYYCIPLCSTTGCSLLSYKISYYTENYSIMYGFGGLRLLTYNYDDAEWEKFVKKEKTLSYN